MCGSAADAITLGAAISNGAVDLGIGSDKLTLFDAANTLSAGNVETVVGGTAADTLTLTAAASNASLTAVLVVFGVAVVVILPALGLLYTLHQRSTFDGLGSPADRRR